MHGAALPIRAKANAVREQLRLGIKNSRHVSYQRRTHMAKRITVFKGRSVGITTSFRVPKDFDSRLIGYDPKETEKLLAKVKKFINSK